MTGQNVIDLGDELVLDVKYAGKTYKLREPTVGEIDSFRERQEGDDSIKVLVSFLVSLGVPADVVPKMGMSKARQLVDGLIEFLTKKK